MSKDHLELCFRLDGRREAEVLRSRAGNLADGRLHRVSVGRLSASVWLQVCGDARTFRSRYALKATFQTIERETSPWKRPLWGGKSRENSPEA